MGIANNTLNTGDNVQDTVGDGTLNYTAAGATLGIVAANPPFANNVTMDGVNTLNATNNAVVVGFPFVAGFAGKVTGLTTVNDNNSLGTIQLGQLGQGLGTLLTNVNISGYSPQSAGIVGGTALFAGIVAQAAADATKTINVSITGPVGTTKAGGADTLIFSNDLGGGTAASPNLSYGTWALTLNSNANLTLQQDFAGFIAGAAFAPIAGGVGAATDITLAGTGNVSLGQDAIGNWRNVTKIDASGESGTVFLPGGTSGLFANSFASAANPAWLFGSAAGLLDDTGTGGTFKLTEYDLGSGTNILDVSSATAAQIGALKTVPNALASLTNTIVVQDSVATTISKTTFANIAGFQTLGIGGPTKAQGAAGTIDMANLPASISNITYFTPANGSVTINDQTAALTVDVKDQTTAAQTLTVGAVGPAPGLNDSLTVSLGNPLHASAAVPGSGGDTIGAITVFGDELFTLNAVGSNNGISPSPPTVDITGLITLSPTLAGNEQVTIGGADLTNVIVGGSTSLGAIADATAGVLNANNMLVTITNTGATIFNDDITPGTLLNFVTDAGANGGIFAPAISYSTNAVVIDASTSGGLIMLGGDANFNDTITGAANPVGFTIGTVTFGDILIGSLGNDTLTSKSLTLPDFIYTDGGKDTITLATGHTGADHVGFYAADGLTVVAAGTVGASVTGAISEGGVAAFEFANPGWWGIGTGGSSTRIDDGAAAPPALLTDGHGTSGSNSTLTGFVASQDFLDFSVKAWSTAGLIGFGLTQDLGALANAAGSASATGAAVNAVQVGAGGSIVGTAVAPTDFIILSQGTFLNADAVASALHTGGSYNVTHSPLGATVEADFLLAYAGTDGNAHIANLHLAGNGASTTTFTDFVTVSDIVTLAGVSLNTLAANTSHIHLVS